MTANAFTDDTWEAYGEEPAPLNAWSGMVVSPAMYEALTRYDELVAQQPQITLRPLPAFQSNPIRGLFQGHPPTWPDVWWVDDRLGHSPAAIAVRDWEDPSLTLSRAAYVHFRGHDATESLLLKLYLRDELERLWQVEVDRVVIGHTCGAELRGILPNVCDPTGPVDDERTRLMEKELRQYLAADRAAFAVTDPASSMKVVDVL